MKDGSPPVGIFCGSIHSSGSIGCSSISSTSGLFSFASRNHHSVLRNMMESSSTCCWWHRLSPSNPKRWGPTLLLKGGGPSSCRCLQALTLRHGGPLSQKSILPSLAIDWIRSTLPSFCREPNQPHEANPSARWLLHLSHSPSKVQGLGRRTDWGQQPSPFPSGDASSGWMEVALDPNLHLQGASPKSTLGLLEKPLEVSSPLPLAGLLASSLPTSQLLLQLLIFPNPQHSASTCYPKPYPPQGILDEVGLANGHEVCDPPSIHECPTAHAIQLQSAWLKAQFAAQGDGPTKCWFVGAASSLPPATPTELVPEILDPTPASTWLDACNESLLHPRESLLLHHPQTSPEKLSAAVLLHLAFESTSASWWPHSWNPQSKLLHLLFHHHYHVVLVGHLFSSRRRHLWWCLLQRLDLRTRAHRGFHRIGQMQGLRLRQNDLAVLPNRCCLWTCIHTQLSSALCQPESCLWIQLPKILRCLLQTFDQQRTIWETGTYLLSPLKTSPPMTGQSGQIPCRSHRRHCCQSR